MGRRRKNPGGKNISIYWKKKFVLFALQETNAIILFAMM